MWGSVVLLDVEDGAKNEAIVSCEPNKYHLQVNYNFAKYHQFSTCFVVGLYIKLVIKSLLKSQQNMLLHYIVMCLAPFLLTAVKLNFKNIE